MLTTWPRHFAKPDKQHHAVGICAYEASLIAARMFVGFLGIGKNRQNPNLHCLAKKKQGGDVWIHNLGGLLPKLGDFQKAEIEALEAIYDYAGGASAHLTLSAGVKGSPEAKIRDQNLKAAAEAICRVIRRNLHAHIDEQWEVWDQLPKTLATFK